MKAFHAVLATLLFKSSLAFEAFRGRKQHDKKMNLADEIFELADDDEEASDWNWPFLQQAYEQVVGVEEMGRKSEQFLTPSTTYSAAVMKDALDESRRIVQELSFTAQVTRNDTSAQPSSTATTKVAAKETHGHWKPIVYVQDFMPYFPSAHPPKIESMNFSMSALYRSPLCPGRKTFVVEANDAPQGFCRYANGQPSMTMEGQRHDDFDQYTMERIMLGKWLESPLRCQAADEWCRLHADIVVVPSLSLHEMLAHGFRWQFSANLSERGKLGKGAPLYWEALRKKFYKPAEGRSPLIVIHSSFAWDWPGHNQVLHALAEQPLGFIQRVVIATTGSNLKALERNAFKQGPGWSDSGMTLLRRRYEHRRKKHETMDGGPLMVTVPYPTSLLHEVRFTESTSTYNADRTRPIAVSLFASRSKDARGANWIRNELLDMMAAPRDGFKTENTSKGAVVCSSAGATDDKGVCGLALQDHSANMWSITANSAFCIEPAGDTLCRSHFYIAVLSGCIPVLVDGGHSSYGSSSMTWWAWRGTSNDSEAVGAFPAELRDFLFDYKKNFFVVQAEKLQQRDFIQELLDMPTNDPERFRTLRENVDRVAPLMRYSLSQCSSYPTSEHPWACRDAFTVFQSIVAHEARYLANVRVPLDSATK